MQLQVGLRRQCSIHSEAFMDAEAFTDDVVYRSEVLYSQLTCPRMFIDPAEAGDVSNGILPLRQPFFAITQVLVHDSIQPLCLIGVSVDAIRDPLRRVSDKVMRLPLHGTKPSLQIHKLQLRHSICGNTSTHHLFVNPAHFW